MRFDRRLIGLGLFLVTAGAVMLAVRQGYVSDAVGGRIWTLWPLLLIGSGLSIVLGGRPGASIGGLVVAVTLGAMLGGLAAAGWAGGFGACGGDRDGTAFAGQSGELTPGASVTIAISCGQLDVGTLAGTTWSVSGTSGDGAPPAITTDAGGLQVENPRQGPFVGGSGRNHWAVVLPRDPGVGLDVTTNGGSTRVVLEGASLRDVSFATNAGSLSLDLRGVASIGDLEVRTNLGSATVRLPERSLAGSIETNAGSIAICAPTGAGLRVTLDGVAGSNDLASHGLVRTADDDTWETPGFASAAVQVELSVDVNAGSLTLDPVRACAG